MGDQKSGQNPNPPSEPPIIPLWPWCVAKIKNKLHQRRAAREKENSQDRSSRRTANATVAIAVLAVVAAVLGALQSNIMRGQLDEMQADRRPWVSLDVRLTGPLLYDDVTENGGKADISRWHIDAEYSIENVGKSPAANLDLGGLLLPPVDDKELLPAVRKMGQMKVTCELPFIGEVVGMGREEIVFPSQKRSGQYLSVESFPDFITKAPIHADFLTVTVCVSYSPTPDDAKRYHTGRSYLLSKKNKEPINWKGETVPFDQLQFVPNPVHNSFAD